jgi:hypothetical protein
VASVPLIGASVGGALLIVLVFLVVFVGAAYGLSRRGGGVGSHPSAGRRRDGENDQAPGAGRPSSSGPDPRPRDEG